METAGTLGLRVAPPLLFGRRALRLIERNALVYRRGWIILVSGFFEPLFYLLSISVGLGSLAGPIAGPGGRLVSYTAFAAPALMASSAMNGAVYDATANVFFKLKFAKVYDAVLATPLGPRDVALGEVGWALIRGAIYATIFLIVMGLLGLIISPWAIVMLPAAYLVSFSFAAIGMGATTFMRTWQDFDFIQMAVLPMFLFSATFYPITTYPPALQVVVRLTPLYQAVALLRGLDFGVLSPVMLGHVLYLVVMAAVGLMIASRRLSRLLLG